MRLGFERSPQFYARLSGGLYVLIIALGLFGEMIARGSLLVPGHPAETARNIAGSPLLYRASIVADLLMQVLDVPVIVILFLVFRPVSETMALITALTNLVQTAVLATIRLCLLVPLFLLEPGVHLQAFSQEQREAISQLALHAHGYGYGIGLVFFGFACLAQGYLIVRSDYLPKVFGVMLAMAGLCYLTNSFALLLVPSFANAIFPGILAPAFVAELSMALWLLFKGVNMTAWEARRRAP